MKTVKYFYGIVICLFFSNCANVEKNDNKNDMNNSEEIKKELAIIRSHLKDKKFAEEMASYMSSTYYKGAGQAIPPFLEPGEDTMKVKKSVKEEKIATNIAGFYALECGVDYLVSVKKQTPVSILKSITEGTISKEDKLLLCRFANATWKAGQPFRSLDRIERETFTNFSSLSEADIEIDWVQIKAAATKLLEVLK